MVTVNSYMCKELHCCWLRLLSLMILLNISDNEGNIIIDSNNIGIINPFRYRGYYYDDETSLYYLNSRYYNPNWCRFVNADSFLIQHNSLLGNNMYVYTYNNPIKGIDFQGQNFFDNLRKGIQRFASDFGFRTTAAVAYALSMNVTAKTLWNSTKDNPKELTEKDLADVVAKIHVNEGFKKAINEIVEEQPNGKVDVGPKGIYLSGFNDMGLSLHGTKLYAKGNLVNGKGTLNIVITDRYDFEYDDGTGGSFATQFSRFFNNLAYTHQELGHINNYDIRIKFDYEVK